MTIKSMSTMGYLLVLSSITTIPKNMVRHIVLRVIS
jgi:hypothetical protein